MEHQRVLGIFAHPDDADVGSGGVLAQFVEAGAEVGLVVATAGDAGGFKEEGQDQIAGVRMAEQRAAAACLGIDDVTFLGHLDGEVHVTSELVRDLVAQIRIHQPTLVITMSPEHNWTNLAASHPDHRAVGEAAIQAIYPASRNPFAFRELKASGINPWMVEEVWLQGHHNPNHYVQLTPGQVEKKAQAVQRHATQFEDMGFMTQYVWELARQGAVNGGLGRDRYAEEFLRYSARE